MRICSYHSSFCSMYHLFQRCANIIHLYFYAWPLSKWYIYIYVCIASGHCNCHVCRFGWLAVSTHALFLLCLLGDWLIIFVFELKRVICLQGLTALPLVHLHRKKEKACPQKIFSTFFLSPPPNGPLDARSSTATSAVASQRLRNRTCRWWKKLNCKRFTLRIITDAPTALYTSLRQNKDGKKFLITIKWKSGYSYGWQQ